jgi:4-hydroxy-tetrahydrodipicolinate synthase
MNKPLTAADLHGIYPAIPTPTTAEETVDKRAVRALIDYLLQGGVNGVPANFARCRTSRECEW